MKALVLLVALAAAAPPPPPLVPRPANLVMRDGAFDALHAKHVVLVPDEPPVRAAAARLAAVLATRGTTLPLITSPAPAPGDIVVELRAAAAGDPEAYALDIAPDRARLTAHTAAGLQRGVSTLAQLPLPWPALSADDRPRFAWRGLCVDVARHFRDAAWMLKLLDAMADAKLDVLHWHLTDDQGWRLPSARFAKLTGNGAAYTPDEIAAVVRRAGALAIRVIPEIDVPGHVAAAVSAYPDLSCRSVNLPVPRGPGVYEDVLCPGSESPFALVEGLAAELARAFPDPLIHLGGDEVPRTRWRECGRCQSRVASEHLRDADDLQAYFLRRASASLAREGRQAIVWDDDLAHGFPPGTVVQAWHGAAVQTAALIAGHAVIASPESPCYLSRPALATPMARCLAFDPVPAAATRDQARRVLGGEAALWTERIDDDAVAERALFPRLYALAEALWSPGAPLDDFAARVEPRMAALRARGFATGDGAHRIALLSPGQFDRTWRQIKLDVTPFVDRPGSYAFALGEDAPVPVEMLALGLSRDGTRVGYVLRSTATTADIEDRTCEILVREVPPRARFELELTVRCAYKQAAVASVWVERR